MECNERLQGIIAGFKDCKNAFNAIGDETRQIILLALLESDLRGIRVGELAIKTHLTRPSVSHHLQILKGAGVISMRKEGTRNFYFLNPDETRWNKISQLINLICESIDKLE